VTEKSLKIENQESIVKESIYNVQGRIESVRRKISASDQISERNCQLIFDFCEHRKLQGLSNLRILFYLNRFWNIARYAAKPFDRMDRHDIETIVDRVQNSGFRPRTVADHLTLIGTFWKWLEGKDEIYDGLRNRADVRSIHQTFLQHDLCVFGKIVVRKLSDSDTCAVVERNRRLSAFK
jgi:hypothetical protein